MFDFIKKLFKSELPERKWNNFTKKQIVYAYYERIAKNTTKGNSYLIQKQYIHLVAALLELEGISYKITKGVILEIA